MGAPVGNKNAAKAKVWHAAIVRALRKRSKSDQLEALDDIADKLIAACETGDLPALKELGDRLDGKATQQTEISGPDGSAVPHSVTVEFVGAKK